MSAFSRREGYAHGYENGQDDARKTLAQAVENVKATRSADTRYWWEVALLREYDRLMGRLSDDESEKSAENPPSEPNHG